jgi:hypothetical protein
VLESVVATTYEVNWDFIEKDLLPVCLGMRTGRGNLPAFQSELERALENCEVSVLYDLRASGPVARWSPRIDPIAVPRRKLHSKVFLFLWRNSGSLTRTASLVVGSANLTVAGFRENYEVAARLDFGPLEKTPIRILKKAVEMLRQMVGARITAQLERQLRAFEGIASSGNQSATGGVSVLDLVAAEEVLPALEAEWKRSGGGSILDAVLVSPFWPENRSAATPVAEWFSNMGGVKGSLEFVCRSQVTGSEKALPLLPGGFAEDLKKALGCRIFVSAAQPAYGVESSDDEAEETFESEEEGKSTPEGQVAERVLHAKMIILQGEQDTLLYIGSSNFTRRGLALGAPSNWEAGLIYRLSGKALGEVEGLLAFRAAGRQEVTSDAELPVAPPEKEEETASPDFIWEIVVSKTEVRISFDPLRTPSLVEIRIPKADGSGRFARIFASKDAPLPGVHSCSLSACEVVDAAGAASAREDLAPGAICSYALVEWDGNLAQFPLRFDNKEDLPLVLGRRGLTEEELIEFYRTGVYPKGGDGDGGGGDGGGGDPRPGPQAKPDAGTDPSKILSYRIRSFVEALPGLEAAIRAAGDCAPALRSCLLMHTGAVALAKSAMESFAEIGGAERQGPVKTPVAAAFQIIEITAIVEEAARRQRSPDCRAVFAEALGLLRGMLQELRERFPADLGAPLFASYESQLLRGKP